MFVRVKDLMKKDLIIIPGDYTLKEAAQEMEVVSCGILPVGTRERIEGIITDRDIILRAVTKGKDVNKEKVRHYMTPEVCSIHEEETAEHAVDLMRERNINRLLVKDANGKFCGILSLGRIIRERNGIEELSAVRARLVEQRAAA